jgi:U4/U6.U5 tri-snRNP-associated protein 1
MSTAPPAVKPRRFHGKPPSKNKQEERQRKYLEEVAIAKATTSQNPSAELDRLKELQRSTGSAYIPLTGVMILNCIVVLP